MTKPRVIAKNLIRLLIAAIVVWGIARAFGNARAEFAEKQLSWQGVRWSWLALSMLAYGAGLLAMGCYWFVTLRALNQRPSLGETIRAYYVGHLGKYVPGKGMVVVLRVGLIRGENVDPIIAGISVFVETLTMMATGAFWAAVVLCFQYRGNNLLMWTAIGTMLLTVMPTLPPVFCAVAQRLKPQFQQRLGEISRGYSFRLFAVGWLAGTLSWLGLAISLGAAMKTLPYADSVESFTSLFPLFLATVTLAVVLGFASLIPGGLGVREWIMNELLGPRIGHLAAFAGTIVVRLIWLVTEVVISIIVYFCLPAPKQTDSIASLEVD